MQTPFEAQIEQDLFAPRMEFTQNLGLTRIYRDFFTGSVPAYFDLIGKEDAVLTRTLIAAFSGF